MARQITTTTTTAAVKAPATQTVSSAVVPRVIDLPPPRTPQQQEQQRAMGSGKIRMVACRPKDVAATVDVYVDAFRGQDFTHWWPADEDVFRAWSERRFANRYGDERTVQFMAVRGGGDNVEVKDVVAYAKWMLPSPTTLGEDDPFVKLRRVMIGGSEDDQAESAVDKGRAGRAREGGVNDTGAAGADSPGSVHHGDHPTDLPEGADAELYKEYFDAMDQLCRKWKSSQMLELSLMCTRPSHHGLGIAGAMIRAVLDQVADPLGTRAILLGLEAATPLYRRLGFQTVETTGFPLAREKAGEHAVMHVMIREPRGSGV